MPAEMAPALPTGRGALSRAVIAALRGEQDSLPDAWAVSPAAAFGEDLQLALYVLYELHYRGFEGVDEALEWDPGLLRLRQALEDRFLTALRRETARDRTVDEAFGELLVEPVDHTGSVSAHLEHDGELWQLREYAALRSLYHLKEAEPHAWVIPRLRGRAKAAMVAIEYDEFGGGRAERMHSRLFADLMKDLDLDPSYGSYLDSAPAEALATVNVMSLFGLHRALRGALVGHFACVEVTSSPGSRRMAAAMRRLEAGPAAEHFYTEHVEADAVHEQLVRREVIAGLLEDEPHLERDIAFGADATTLLEGRLGSVLLAAWSRGESALTTPLISAGAGAEASMPGARDQGGP
ncbi:iron-containing redox enzyme family protein [Streptomyces sp. ISL-87]|nr:iron-containing redox enzyme family protein [Streptomyces sp. ISL-21]MBT2459852.1 iron-containing redox enzyme family protein [Streptomyces sp. ISL-86]MBT2608837.1 iron-containing redox enzyme family protein [Streptomyces sp. ISL-87]